MTGGIGFAAVQEMAALARRIWGTHEGVGDRGSSRVGHATADEHRAGHDGVDSTHVCTTDDDLRPLVERRRTVPPLVDVGHTVSREEARAREEEDLVRAGMHEDRVIPAGVGAAACEEVAARGQSVVRVHEQPFDGGSVLSCHVAADEEAASQCGIDASHRPVHRDYVSDLGVGSAVPPLWEVRDRKVPVEAHAIAARGNDD